MHVAEYVIACCLVDHMADPEDGSVRLVCERGCGARIWVSRSSLEIRDARKPDEVVLACLSCVAREVVPKGVWN